VLLDIGTNKQPSEPKHTNTHSGNSHGLLLVLHRSDRWPAPVRPVDRVGQASGYSIRTTSVPKSLSDFSTPWNKNTPKHNLHGRSTGQTGVTWQLGMYSTRRSTPPNPNFDLPNRSTDFNKTLGIVGTLHKESIATILAIKTCQIKRNRRNPAKNSSNPKHRKPQNRDLNSRIWEGNQRQKNHEGFTRISPIKSPKARSRQTPKKPPKEGSENHHQEQPGTTQQSLEESRRIIYTYQGGSYKV
jgi:hypothetical protein